MLILFLIFRKKLYKRIKLSNNLNAIDIYKNSISDIMEEEEDEEEEEGEENNFKKNKMITELMKFINKK